MCLYVSSLAVLVAFILFMGVCGLLAAKIEFLDRTGFLPGGHGDDAL